MDDFVREMHTKSGLLPEIESSDRSSVAAAEQATLEYVKQHVPKPSTAPLCGNSIGTDRRFLARYMTELDDYLHYRSIDVSSLKELCRRWYPALYRKRPGKAEHHRALDDIRESIEELRFYRDNLLRPPETPARTGVSTPRYSGPSHAGSEELVEGAEERGDRVLAGAVAHEADAPALAGERHRGRRRPRCRSGGAARRAPWRRRRRRGATPT